MMFLFFAIFLLAAPAVAQQTPQSNVPPAPERWNFYWQATSIGDGHGTFRSPYSGPFSLQNRREADVSFTTTLFLGFQLWRNTQMYVNPEIAGGRGLSGVNGLANAPNGEMPRVLTATPKPYLARGYITHDFSFGEDREETSSDENQLAGLRPARRYSISIGRFSDTDFFDGNRYTHDPRRQFMAWGVMYSGSWDYPADTRGYTWGWVHEYHTPTWSVRYGSAFEPLVANGERFDHRILRDRGDTFEGEKDFSISGHRGAVRVMSYLNHTDSGKYADAIRLARQTSQTPDITAVRKTGTLKYGFGISADQEITKNVGAFLRLGWNDGKTQSFAFTAIDRLASAGVSVKGDRWKRPQDEVATSLTVNGISGVHASYLAMGGYDFLIGDGRLNRGLESGWETYYNARLFPGFYVSYDVMHYVNPAYNRDRGPVLIQSIRLHLEFGKPTFFASGH